MKPLLLLLLSVAAFAQTLAPSVSPASLRPGQSTTVTLNYAGSSGGIGVSGIQWDLVDGPLTSAAPVAGTAAVGKQISANGSRAIVVGVNAGSQGGIPNGVLATVVLTAPAGTPSGPISVSLTGLVGTDSAGNAVNIIPGSAVTVTVLPPLGDLNGDGKVDAADLGVAVSQALGIAACTTGDINGDGKCNVQDVILVAKQIP